MAEELAAKLARRNMINDGEKVESVAAKTTIYSEFPEFSRKEIKQYEATFKKYNTSNDGNMDLLQIKYMMEKLGAPQTHIGLKEMIAEIDEDHDDKMNFREFLTIFRKAAKGELKSAGLSTIATTCNVAEEGVTGAKSFFEAKAAEVAKSSKFEEEIKAEQEAKKQEAELAKKRKEEFKKKLSGFQANE